MSKIDFLKQNTNQIRKSIKDIDDSYNNEWDILAELAQNAVDAIRKRGVKKGEISLFVDSQNKSIKISDNGCGISSDKLPILLAPFSTDKEEDENSIGEKGVGLTFVIFTCNNFSVKSGDGNSTSEGTILDANNWKISNNNDLLELSHKILDEKQVGTTVELREIIPDSLFQLSFNQLKFILRSRTALGNTNTIWQDDIDIDIKFNHKNQDGTDYSEKLEFKFHLPTEGYPINALISINDFWAFIKADKSDKQKRDKLFGKFIIMEGKYEHRGRTIKYWSCFVPQRKTWDDISIHNKLCTQDQINNPEWLDSNNITIFHSGIYTSVKGMPTGVHINNPITGSQSYWAQIFILFDDKQIKFDIGRKALPGRQSEVYRKKSKEIFNEYAKIFKYVGRKELDEKPEWQKNTIFAEIEKELDLSHPTIKLRKYPSKQESAVAGLFYECIGNGLIKDIYPMTSGYKSKYDLYAKWGDRQIVIEFKAKLENILADFNDEVKMFDELDCVVCWNVDEEDERTFKNKNITLEEIVENELVGNRIEFPNATHKLTLPFVHPIYIIDLKKLADNSRLQLVQSDVMYKEKGSK